MPPKASRNANATGAKSQALPAPSPIGPSTPLGEYSATDVGLAIFASS
jgi:hypothetical protein